MDFLVAHGTDLLFYAFAAIVVTGAVFVVTMRNPMYSALSLLATFLSMAALFFLQHAEFLGVVQIFVYGGGIMVLEMLHILEHFDLEAFGHNSADYIRIVSEAMKRASALRVSRTLQQPTATSSDPRAVASSGLISRSAITSLHHVCSSSRLLMAARSARSDSAGSIPAGDARRHSRYSCWKTRLPALISSVR